MVNKGNVCTVISELQEATWGLKDLSALDTHVFLAHLCIHHGLDKQHPHSYRTRFYALAMRSWWLPMPISMVRKSNLESGAHRLHKVVNAVSKMNQIGQWKQEFRHLRSITTSSMVRSVMWNKPLEVRVVDPCAQSKAEVTLCSNYYLCTSSEI